MSLATANVETGSRPALHVEALASPWLGAGLVALAIAHQCLSHQNGDNSWLMTVAEKWVDGARAYVDVIESNPPAVFLYFAPAVWLSRLTRAPVEFFAAAQTFLLAGGVIALAARILLRAGLVAGAQAGLLLNAAIFALVLTPCFSFAEREHVACLLVTPVLAIYVARARSTRVDAGVAALAGLLAGLAFAIKPHFALAVALPFLYVWRQRRAISIFFAPEQIGVLIGVIVNIVVVLRWFPDYVAIAPVMLEVYVPLKEPWSYLLVEPWFVLNFALLGGLVWALGRDVFSPGVAAPGLASIGFLLTFVIQGKGWVNHGLPGVELAFLAAAAGLAPRLFGEHATRDECRAQLRTPMMYLFLPCALAAPLLFGLLLPAQGFEEYRRLRATIERVAPAHPRIIAIASRLDVGHPVTRRVGGTWVGRPNALWLMIFSRMYIDAKWGDEAWRARLATYIDRDARGFREDVEKGHPDVVLVTDDPRVAKAMQHPDIAAAMADYAPVDKADGVAIWMRR